MSLVFALTICSRASILFCYYFPCIFRWLDQSIDPFPYFPLHSIFYLLCQRWPPHLVSGSVLLLVQTCRSYFTELTRIVRYGVWHCPFEQTVVQDDWATVETQCVPLHLSFAAKQDVLVFFLLNFMRCDRLPSEVQCVFFPLGYDRSRTRTGKGWL